MLISDHGIKNIQIKIIGKIFKKDFIKFFDLIISKKTFIFKKSEMSLIDPKLKPNFYVNSMWQNYYIKTS